MKPTLREALAASHVGAIAVTVLLFWWLYWGFYGLLALLIFGGNFLVTAVSIRGVPSMFHTISERLLVVIPAFHLFGAVFSFAAAWLLSHWVYGLGPLRSLITVRMSLLKRTHA